MTMAAPPLIAHTLQGSTNGKEEVAVKRSRI